MHAQPPFPSHVDVPEEDRTKLINGLNKSLATSLDLYSQVKQAHWNIKGPQFFARHELFDKLATRVLEWADEFAERAATLGGYAKGTLRLGTASSEIEEYDLSAIDGTQHVRALVDRYATFAERLRVRVKEAHDADDAATEDLFVEVLRAAELDMWFLESHLVSTNVEPTRGTGAAKNGKTGNESAKNARHDA